MVTRAQVYKYTLGNRRARSFFYTLVKMGTIAWLQAQISADVRAPGDAILSVFGYIWLVVITLMLVERYIREIYAVKSKRPMNLKINKIEMIIFAVYTTYCIFTATLHLTQIWKEVNREYNENPRLQEKIPLPAKLAYEFLEVLIRLYIVVDKFTHFLHVDHSVSLYLEVPKPVPNMKAMHSPHLHRDGDSEEDDEMLEGHHALALADPKDEPLLPKEN